VTLVEDLDGRDYEGGDISNKDRGLYSIMRTTEELHSDVAELCPISGREGWIAYTSFYHTARVWDLRTDECIWILAGHSGDIMGLLELSNDVLVTTSRDDTIRLWKIRPEAESELQLVSHKRITPNCRVIDNVRANCVVAIINKTFFVTGDTGDQSLRVWNSAGGFVTKCTLPVTPWRICEGTRDGEVIVQSSMDHVVVVQLAFR